MNKNLFAPRTFIWKTLRQPDGHAMLLWAVVVGVAGASATAAFREGIDLLQKAVVQITGAGEKRRIHHYLIVLKGLPSK
jgi:hypothetical protein